MTRRALPTFLLFSIFLFSFSMLNAQLGEVAGQPTFYVNISGTYTYNYTFLNSGSTPIPVQVLPPSLSPIPSMASEMKNATTPILTVTPLNGTIAPESQFRVEVKIYMPSKNNKPGYTWQGVLQVIEEGGTSTSGGSGAVIRAGVAKIVTITATPAIFPWSLAIGIIAIAIVVAIAIAYYAVRRSKAKAKAAERAARLAMAKRRITGKAAKRAAVPAKKVARKRAARKGAKRTSRTKTATRRRKR